MSGHFAFALGFVAGAVLFDQLWRYVDRLRGRLQDLKDEDRITQAAIRLNKKIEQSVRAFREESSDV
jgi:hypothetical protein